MQPILGQENYVWWSKTPRPMCHPDRECDYYTTTTPNWMLNRCEHDTADLITKNLTGQLQAVPEQEITQEDGSQITQYIWRKPMGISGITLRF